MTRVIVGSCALSVLLGIAPARACSFVERPAEAIFARADVVFVGAVSSVEYAGGRRALRVALLEVHDVYKGDVPPTVVVATAASEGACDVAFVPGERYSVFGALRRGTVYTDASRVSLGDERLTVPGYEPIARYPLGGPGADRAADRTSRAGLMAAALLLIGLAAIGHLVRRRMDWHPRHAI